MSKKEALIVEFRSCVKNLERVLSIRKNDITRDCSIKRFELAADVAWKTVKEVLYVDFGVNVNSPKTAFREAFKQGLIDYEDGWIKLVDTRNETAHTYKEELAEEIYSKIPEYLELFQILLQKLTT